MASSLITTYLGSGLLASRPAVPSIPANGLAVWRSTDTGTTSVYDTAWHDLGSGGGGGGVTPPGIRGSVPALQYGSVATSYTFTFPTGSVVGDTAVIFSANGYSPNTPSGWTLVASAGSTMAGAIYYKVLNSSDILAGSVTVTTGTAYSFVAGLVVFAGTFTVRASRAAYQQNISVTTSDCQAGDYALFATFSRDNSTPPYNGIGTTLTSSRGAPDARANGYISGLALPVAGGVSHFTEAFGYWWSGMLVLAHA